MARRGVLRWRFFAGSAMAAVLGACARPTEEAAFTERVAARFRAAIPGAKVTVNAPRAGAEVRRRHHVDATRKSGVNPVVRPFAGDLWKVYVFDLPDAMRVVAADDLPALKLDLAQLDVLAMDNLGRRLASFPMNRSNRARRCRFSTPETATKPRVFCYTTAGQL
jgi:hypothetical protein